MSVDEPQANTAKASALQTLSREELATNLKQLEATATQQYALKNYGAAAEAFSEAVEVQDAINGEMAVENVELLFLYGRCLFQLGISKSDVLGGKVAQHEEPKRKKRKVKHESAGNVEDNVDATALEQKAFSAEQTTNDSVTATSATAESSKPFFHFTGDENFTDSEEEDDDAEEDAEEEDDDLAIAYEILDIARVLLDRKLDALETGGTTDNPTSEIRAIKERLADTYDLQAEIKLENEQFKDAVVDAQQALLYKQQLYAQETGEIAEAHFKVSIALNYASQPVRSPDGEIVSDGDEDMRKQSAEEMEKAIMSCQARLKKYETELAGVEGVPLEKKKREIADTRDIVQDLKNRLVDIRNPTSAAIDDNDEMAASLKGLLGEMLGQSKADQLKMLSQATATANDLSGLIKQKKKPKTEPANTEAEGTGKRKMEDPADEKSDTQSNGKKVKFEAI